MPAEIRRVYASDREDVLAISRYIWEGHDYLPSVIDSWLNEPSSFMYGVEIGNRLAAVANLRLVENGRTGWMEGLRVHPDFRRQGFADLLTKHLLEEAGKIGVQRLRYTTSTENHASVRLGETYGFTPILQMGVFWHPTPKAPPSVKAAFHIRRASPKEVYVLLRNASGLITRDILIYDWKALDVTREALETIGRSHEFYVAAKEGKIDSLSLGHHRRNPAQAQWSFTTYALEPTGFLAHLSHNITVASKQGFPATTGTFEIHCEAILHEAEWVSEEYWATHMVLLEKNLK
jgi:GNAT superfamily N-acetyltransferase